MTDAEIDERAQAASLSLFGMAQNDTFGPGLAVDSRTAEQIAISEARHPAWEVGFLTIYDDRYDDEEYRDYWLGHGVDGTDGNGEMLRCFDRFSRQLMLVFVQRSMMPDAVFTPDGTGGPTVSAERWGAALEEDARRFKRR